MSYLRVPLLLLIGSLTISSPAARAANFCVADDIQLRAALVAAGSNGQGDQIRVRAGVPVPQLAASPTSTYELSLSDGASIDISGGWTDAACTQQRLQPLLTQLAPLGQRNLLKVDAHTASSPLPKLTLRNLTLTTYGQAIPQTQGCLLLVSGHLDVLISRVLATDSHCPNGPAVVTALSAGEFGLQNSQFTYVTAAASLIRGYAYSGTYAREVWMSNNSFLYNHVLDNSYLVDVRSQDPTQVWIENNVVWANQLEPAPNGRYYFFETNSAPLSQARGNRLQAEPVRFVLANSDYGNSLGDPGLRPQGLLLVPAANSALRDAGASNPRGGLTTRDLAGDPRSLEGGVDIGAYEYQPPLFADGFE
jgi:hypothetical protein